MERVAQHMAAWAATVSISLAGGCGTPNQAVATDVAVSGWVHPARLTLTNNDTTTLRDLEVFVRCNDLFKDDTLTVRITTLSPDTLHFSETLQLFIPRATSPAALAQEAVTPYRQHVCFAHTGNYRMTIVPVRPVQGIEAVGVNIVKSK